MKRTNYRVLLFVVFVVTYTTGGSDIGAAENRVQRKLPISVADLYRFDGPRSLVLSPDGKQAAYVRSWIDKKTKSERRSLWLVEDNRENRKPLEEGEPDARSPLFSPDGKWIVFLSTRSRPDGWKQTRPTPPQSEAATDIWLIPTSGGKAIPLAGRRKSYGRVFGDRFYGRIAFSPDGTRLVFTADDGLDPRTRQEIEADVEIVRPDQGEGYTGLRPSQVWVAHLDKHPEDHAATRIDRLTNDDVWYGSPQWSPDGRTIVVHANRTADRESVRYSINKNYDLWAIDVTSRKIRRLTSGPGPEVSPRFSPDGRRIACLSAPRKGPHADIYNLAIVSFESDQPRMKIVFDHHGRNADHRSNPSPSFPLMPNCWDGADHLIYSAVVGTASKTLRINLKTGSLTESVSPNAQEVARSRRKRELTPRVSSFLRNRLIAESRVVRWTNRDRMQIEGVLTVPPPSIAKPPYKLLVYPHGGPHSRSGKGFNFTTQVFAAKGYLVFQPNFRGTSGYGLKFLDADRNDFGGGDMRDILDGIEFLVKQSLVNRDQQYVYGVSYGGFMTSWLIGHTNQFRAAVAQNAVTDLNVMWGLSDLQSWTEWEFGGRPWEVAAAMRKHSPITYAGDVKTPTLILHSREDRRCPIAMGRMFYQSLLARGVKTQMVIYPHEGHGIRQPKHRADVLRRTLAWFKQSSTKRAN